MLVIIACGVLLAASVFTIWYFIAQRSCVFSAPTGLCYTQSMIDSDTQRQRACEDNYVREHPDATGSEWKMGCVIAR